MNQNTVGDKTAKQCRDKFGMNREWEHKTWLLFIYSQDGQSVYYVE